VRNEEGEELINPVRNGQGFDPVLNKELMLSISTIPT
jgi:hypothetical protein